MTRKKVLQIDAATGESVEFVAVVRRATPNGFEGKWVAMGQLSLLALAQSDLRGDDLRVFLALLATLDFENHIQVNQSRVAELLEMKRQNVGRSVRRLVEREVLLEGPKIGTRRSYRLNPSYGWRGRGSAHRKVLREEQQRRREASGIRGVIDGGKAPKEEPLA